MGFKLPGKSMTSGTSAHSSALKMREHQIATSFKPSPAKSPEYDAAAKVDPELGNYVTERTRIKESYGGDRKKYRASEEYKANQSKINKAYGIDDGYTAPVAEETVVNPTKKEVITQEGKTKGENIISEGETKAGKVMEKTGNDSLDDLGKLGIYKTERKAVRNEQKTGRKLATRDVKLARATYGRGSDEVKAAKAKRRANRKADRVERRTMRKDQRANKAVQRAERKGTERSINRAERLNKKAEDYASTSHKGNLIGD